MKKIVNASLLSISLIFTASCHRDRTQYTYVKNDNIEIILYDYSDSTDDDVLLFFDRLNDNKVSSVDLTYQGNFCKDSVDVAIKRYFEEGIIPTIQDMN